MGEERNNRRPIWVSWRVHEDGHVQVTSTYSGEGGYEREGWEYGSLESAAAFLGSGFTDVVTRAIAEGSFRGRWRP